MCLASIGRVAPVLLLLSCSSIGPAQRENSPQAGEVVEPRYSIVYIIHGDGGYGYHDSAGSERNADEVALFEAKAVAENNTEAEVFIFHEKRRRRFLRLFWPLSDGAFYYYRNGHLIAYESYRRHSGSSRFDGVVALHDRFRSRKTAVASSVFLYFGHAIPEFAGTGYDASYKKRSFTVEDLADGLRGLRQDSTKFDLVILSTCFSGTPHTVSTLAPYARYIIASPDNLHLSYFDANPLERPDVQLQQGDVGEFAKAFAKGSFDRLAGDLQTTITVAVYDVNRANTYASSVDSMYVGTLAATDGVASALLEYYDCAENPAYALPGMGDGVDMYYRAARFGRNKHKQGHSGWECVRPASVGPNISGF